MLDRAGRRASPPSLVWLTLACAACQAHAVAPPDALESSDEGEYGEDAGGGSPGLTTTPTTSASTTSASTTGGEPTGSEFGTIVDATGSTGTTGDTTGPSASCGDGIVDGEEGEQCDLGYANNSDVGGPCTQACELAYCGDGLVRVEEEQCDLGPDNNDAEYGGCREDCTLGPRCGDGVKQAVEECDDSAPPTEGDVECDPGNCNFEARVAFVTAATFTATGKSSRMTSPMCSPPACACRWMRPRMG